ncbi:MAG: glycosyltransferase [Pirellulaceae bacterium]|nr:glycosyltransferase [Pirellulaceae bacterium]
MSHTLLHRRIRNVTPVPLRPIRVLALRAVDGAGGGADKIMLRNAACVSADRVQMAVCFMHHVDDREYDLADRAAALRLRHYTETHHGPFDGTIFKKIRQITDAFQPDIIHSHDYKASFIATMINRRYKNIIRLATSHGWTGDKIRERHLLYPADKLVLRTFPGIVAVSNQIRDALINSGSQPERIRVVLNGIDPHEFSRNAEARLISRRQLGFSPEHIVLGAAGRVEHQKRFDLLVELFDQLSQTDSRLRLVIAGEGSLLDSLRRDVQRRHLQDRCHLLGHCANMKQTYQAFDLFVQTSDYEGTPTVVVEAMALEIPVVATDAGGTSQLIRDRVHGRVTDRRDIASLSQAIRETLSDESQTTKQIQAARRRVESELSFEQRTEQLQDIYRELLENRQLKSG